MLKLLKQKVKFQEIGNKISNINSLVKKTDYNIKIIEAEKTLTDYNHDKYITTPEFNKLSAEAFDARLARVNLVTKTDFDDKLRTQNQKIDSNKTKYLLVEIEPKKLKTFDSGYFRREIHFEEDGRQNYLVFQPMYRYLKKVSCVGTGNDIYFWKTKGLFNENITASTASDCSLNRK